MRDRQGEMQEEPSDEMLVAAIGDGDVGALRILHRRHAPWLRVRLYRRCSNWDLVDEALQDAFLAVWKSAGKYQGRGQVAAWIWGIAVRRLIGVMRRSNRPRWTFPIPSVDPSAEEVVLLGVQYGDLQGALNRLSPELLAVLQARLLDGLNTRETARALGIPQGTVKTRLRRARLQLREELS